MSKSPPKRTRRDHPLLIVNTGQGKGRSTAPSEWCCGPGHIADLVSEMHKVKHPYDEGIRGQQGIEW